MKHLRNHNFKKAFTLAEMMISMTLLALLAGCVLLFISAMGNFSKGNSSKITRISQELKIREEIDLWFSAMDSEGCEIFLNLGNTLVKASSSKGEYYIRFRNVYEQEILKESYLQFYYPTAYGSEEPTRVVELSSDKIISIWFAKQDEEGDGSFPEDSEQTLDDEFVFPIKTHVVPNSYLCKILYDAK